MCWSISRRLSSALFYLPTKNKAAKSTHAFMARYPELNVGVVLDNDVGGDIGVIINKCKPGVCPADGGRRSGARVDAVGLDANEMLMRTIAGLRRFIRILTLTAASLQIPGLIPCMRRASAAAMFPTSFPGGRSAVGYPADGDING